MNRIALTVLPAFPRAGTLAIRSHARAAKSVISLDILLFGTLGIDVSLVVLPKCFVPKAIKQLSVIVENVSVQSRFA